MNVAVGLSGLAYISVSHQGETKKDQDQVYSIDWLSDDVLPLNSNEYCISYTRHAGTSWKKVVFDRQLQNVESSHWHVQQFMAKQHTVTCGHFFQVAPPFCKFKKTPLILYGSSFLKSLSESQLRIGCWEVMIGLGRKRGASSRLVLSGSAATKVLI